MFESCLACAKGLVENCLKPVGCVKRGRTGCSCSGDCRLGRAGVKGREETFCPGKGVDVMRDERLGNPWGVENPPTPAAICWRPADCCAYCRLVLWETGGNVLRRIGATFVGTNVAGERIMPLVPSTWSPVLPVDRWLWGTKKNRIRNAYMYIYQY